MKYVVIFHGKIMVMFLLRHVVVHFTGRPPCSTQQVVRGQALCLYTPSLQPGGSKSDTMFILTLIHIIV